MCSGLGSLGDPTPERGYSAILLCWLAGHVLKTRCNFVAAVMKFGFTGVEKERQAVFSHTSNPKFQAVTTSRPAGIQI